MLHPETGRRTMTIEQKARLIAALIAHLRAAAVHRDRAFDEGDTFFALAFRSDVELARIARACGL